jgi:acyl carrier protein
MSTETTINEFIVDSLLVGSNRTRVEPDEPLTRSGLIDSLGMLRLIGFLEQQFDIEIGDGEVGEENFGTLGRLAAFVDRKRGMP